MTPDYGEMSTWIQCARLEIYDDNKCTIDDILGLVEDFDTVTHTGCLCISGIDATSEILADIVQRRQHQPCFSFFRNPDDNLVVENSKDPYFCRKNAPTFIQDYVRMMPTFRDVLL
jgi:uncharacterized protein YrrD